MTDLELVITRSRKLRPRTKELYLRCVRSFLTFAGTGQKHWTTTAVQAWREDMQKRGVKPQSINVGLNALRFAARPAQFADRVDMLPVASAKAGRALTFTEGKRLVTACSGSRPRDLRDMAFVVLGLRTGMLRFSMCQLLLDDVDLSSNQMTFVKKGGQRHTFTLDPTIHAALAPWIEWLHGREIQSGPLFRSIGREREDPRSASRSRTISTNRGQPGGLTSVGEGLTPDGLYRALQQRAKYAEMPNLTLHMFRETFLRWAAKAGAAPHQIAMVTGHKSDGEIPEGPRSADPPANMLIPEFVIPVQ